MEGDLALIRRPAEGASWQPGAHYGPAERLVGQGSRPIAHPDLQELYKTAGSWHALLITFWRLPLIYLAMMVVRCLCICLLNPIFRLAGSHMSPGEVVFATVGGLRGAISLVLAQVLVTQANPNPEQKDQQRVTAQVRPQNLWPRRTHSWNRGRHSELI